jgi:succinoglycan biosynthesis transport protein ExoP
MTGSDSNQRLEYVLLTLYRYKIVWIAPAILGAVLALYYATMLSPQIWSARQSMIVRDDLLGQSYKPGRFDSIESMKSAQETILEIARQPQVIRNAMVKLGPPENLKGESAIAEWPNEETIEDMQDAVLIHAPNGAEFGKTEVIVLNVKQTTPERSLKFIELLLIEIIAKVDEVRSMRLQSMEVELTRVRDAAMAELKKSKDKLTQMDKALGSDIATMNALSDPQNSDNSIKRDISQIRIEKREATLELEKRNALLSQLKEAKTKPDRILGLSAGMIGILPALDDLKKEMIEKQAEFAVAMGVYQPGHPKYARSKKAIDAMRQQIHLELDLCIAAMENEVKDANTRWSRLDNEMKSLDLQLTKLSENRTEILTLVAELKERTEIANKAQSNLAEIKSLAEAGVSNLIARVDEPQVSTRPDGPGKKLKILVGGFAGLMLGLGIVLLIAPPLDPEQSSFGGGPEGDGPSPEGPEDPNPKSSLENPSRHYPIFSDGIGSTPAYGAYGVSSPTPSVTDLLAASKEVLPPPISSPQATATLPREVKIRPAKIDRRKRRFVVRPDGPSTAEVELETLHQGSSEHQDVAQPSSETRPVEFVDPRSFPRAEDTSAPTLKRRSPSVRAVDLAKTAASEDAAFQRTTPSNQESGGASSSPRARDESMGIPEQIQKLSDSIARYANPNPMDSVRDDRGG